MAKATRNYLALDLGAESGRGIVGRFDGKSIELEEVHRFQHNLVEYRGSLRWDALDMSAQLRRALALAAERTRGRLASLGVDTWGVDYVLLDRNDDLLSYPYRYRDSRHDRAYPAVLAKLSQKEIYSVTGIQFMPINTLYQVYAEVMAKTGALAAAKTLLFMPDFLAFTLGGARVCEYTIASTSQMLDARRRAWARPMLERLGIPTGILPKIVEPATVTGTLRPEIAAATGAPADMKIVAPGSHDTASAVAAVPAEGDGWAYISSGTWSLVGIETGRPVIGAEATEQSFTNEGGLERTIRLLINVMGLWIIQELRRAWTDRQGNAPDYAELARLAEAARPFGPLINPDWPPFGKPGEMPQKIVRYCKATGQKPPRTQGEFVRCTLESLALAYRTVVDKLNALGGGRPISRLHIVGGGSRNRLLNQLTADACQCEVLTGPVEATALGNIMAQMLADGKIGSVAEGRALLRASLRPERYHPASREAWQDACGRYAALVGQTVEP